MGEVLAVTMFGEAFTPPSGEMDWKKKRGDVRMDILEAWLRENGETNQILKDTTESQVRQHSEKEDREQKGQN